MTQAEKVRAVIERETGVEVCDSTALDTLEMDSLEFMAMIQAVEGETEREIPQSLLGSLKTVGDIVALAA